MGSLPEGWRCIVIAALERLRCGDNRGFEDALWLGLGDAWWPLRKALIRKGLIEINSHSVYPSLTSRGEAMLQRELRSVPN